jgi:fibronectin type 3 domain-containing protein
MSISHTERIIAGDMIIPPPPTNAIASPIDQTNHVNVSWVYTSNDVDFFRVYRNITDNFTLINETSNKYYLDSNLSDNQYTEYKITAVDNGPNESPFSNIASTTSYDMDPPSIPLNLSYITPITGYMVNLSWKKNLDDTIAYQVYRNTTLITTTAQTMYTDTNVHNKINYTYYVRAQDEAGHLSLPSNTVIAQPQDLVPPIQVQNLKYITLTNNSISVSWDSIEDAYEYIVTINNTLNIITKKAELTINSLPELENHTFRVKAVDRAGNMGNFSEPITVTTYDWSPPQAPQDLKIDFVSSFIAKLSWTKAFEAEFYRVFINSTAGYEEVMETRDFSALIQGLSPDTKYFVYVQSHDRVNNTARTEILSFRTKMPPPTVFAVSPEGDDVPVSTNITVVFDQPMNRTRVQNAFTMVGITGEFKWPNDSTLTFDPHGDLQFNKTYHVTITTEAMSLEGLYLQKNYPFSFTTEAGEAEPEPEPPDVDREKWPFSWAQALIIIALVLFILILVVLTAWYYKRHKPEEESLIFPSEVDNIDREMEFAEAEPADMELQSKIQVLESSLALEEELLDIKQKELERMGVDPDEIIPKYLESVDLEVIRLDEDEGGPTGFEMDEEEEGILELIKKEEEKKAGKKLSKRIPKGMEVGKCQVCQTDIEPGETYCHDCRKFGLNLDKIPCPFCTFENSWMATRCSQCGEEL